jgi:hypothetical protein
MSGKTERQKTLEFILKSVKEEMEYATEKYGEFNSYHEGISVLREEVEELWDEIRGEQNPDRIIKEAVQVTAMGLRFILDTPVENISPVTRKVLDFKLDNSNIAVPDKSEVEPVVDN